ncbi:hypothetical protein [Amycolatopsis sp. NPDC001319]|uniref:hypothetical protein n=1 Tax=unclassified Amycolatopsis TaxID=2618356 RepID=UPI0036AEB5D2
MTQPGAGISNPQRTQVGDIQVCYEADQAGCTVEWTYPQHEAGWWDEIVVIGPEDTTPSGPTCDTTRKFAEVVAANIKKAS